MSKLTERRRLPAFCNFILMSLLMAGSLTASAAVFVKFDGVDGESTEIKHKDWIQAEYVTWSISSSVAWPCLGGSCAGKTTFSDVAWGQAMDKSFPTLFEKLANGTKIPKATVDFTVNIDKGDPVTYFKMEFEDVVLTSLSLTGTGSSLTENGSFGFNKKVTLTYTPYDIFGKALAPTKGSYDPSSAKAASFEFLSAFSSGMSGPTILSAVPEPEVFAMMLVGIGVFGFARQYKKLKAGV